MRHGDEVKNGIRRTTERNHHGNRILERLAGKDVARAQTTLDHFHHGYASSTRIHRLLTRDGVLRGAVWKRHTERFDRAGHRVCGVHSTAGTGAGNRVLLDEREFTFVDLAAGMFADRLEARHDVEGLVGEQRGAFFIESLLGENAVDAAGKNRSAINKHGRAIQTRHRDETPRHVLVATADGHEAVEHFAAHHSLDAVGDDLTRHEGILHSLAAHRDAVGNRDSSKDDAFSAACANAGLSLAGEFVDVHVARRDHAPCAGDADLGLLEILPRKPHGVQHGATRGAFGAVSNLT